MKYNIPVTIFSYVVVIKFIVSGVCPSINNCRIFISRIPPTTPSAEIVRLLYALTDEVQEVRIRRAVASCAAIVEYRSHRGAAMARKALVAAAAAAWGCGARPAVDWSLPQSPQLLRQYREVPILVYIDRMIIKIEFRFPITVTSLEFMLCYDKTTYHNFT